MAAIVALMSIRLERPDRTRPHANFTHREVLGGLHYLRDDRRLRSVFLLVASFGILGMGYDAMIPAYTRRIVNAGVGGYSLLLSFSGIGATCGAIFVASLAKQRRKDHWAIVGLLIFAGFLGTAAFLPTWAGMLGTDQLRMVVAAFCLLGAGFGAVVFYASAMTIVQLESPDHLRGRIMGIWMIVFSGSVPLGALWTGKAATLWGVGKVMASSALSCAFVGFVVMVLGSLASKRDPRPRFDS